MFLNPTKGMQNAPQIKPRTLKIHPLGNEFTPKMLPRWIQATLGAHRNTTGAPEAPNDNSMHVFINFRLELYSHARLCFPHAILPQDR